MHLSRFTEYLRSGTMPPAGAGIAGPPASRQKFSQAVTSFVRLRDSNGDVDIAEVDAPPRRPGNVESGTRAEKRTSSRAALPLSDEAATADIMQLLPGQEKF